MEYIGRSNESLISELEAIREELRTERAKRLQLEEDCDLLSVENLRLADELHKLQELIASGSSAPTLAPPSRPAADLQLIDDNVFLVEGDGKFATHEELVVPNACAGKNVTCAAFLILESCTRLVCGGADNSLRVYSSRGEQIWFLQISAPVLSVDTNGGLIACSCMDGSHYLVDFSNEDDVKTLEFKNHIKYAVCIRFSLDGKYLAVASHDQSTSIYTVTRNETGELSCTVFATLRLGVTPEAVIFVPLIASTSEMEDSTSSIGSLWELVIAVRDKPFMVFFDCQSHLQREVSLNENAWDTHVSFTPLHLSLSPSMKHLLVSTNKGQHIISNLSTNKRIRLLAAHDCNDYGKPGTAWDPSGKYLYSLSDSGFKVLVYCLASERVIGRLTGHTGAVRSVACHPVTRQVITASFDKSIRLWSLEDN